MNRRDAALVLFLGPIAFTAAIGRADAQQAGKVYRIGYLSAPSRESVEQALEAFKRALRQLGWIEGQNLVIEYRWADGKLERLPDLALELIALNVDLIVAPAGSAALAAKKATSSIPIIMMFPADPVELGLVASLRRPGGNVTGTSSSPGVEIFGKQVEFLKVAFPNLVRVAFLTSPADPGTVVQLKQVEVAARSLGIQLQTVVARGPEEFDSAFAEMARERADAVLVSRGTTFLVHRARIAELAMKARLPTMYSFRECVDAGGLMAYAVNMVEFAGRAATYVDRILKGAKAADLAVEQPTRFELAVNLKTAKALGLSFPRSFLASADYVIQ